MGAFKTSENVAIGQKPDICSWAVTLAFPDLGKKGNLGGSSYVQVSRLK